MRETGGSILPEALKPNRSKAKRLVQEALLGATLLAGAPSVAEAKPRPAPEEKAEKTPSSQRDAWERFQNGFTQGHHQKGKRFDPARDAEDAVRAKIRAHVKKTKEEAAPIADEWVRQKPKRFMENARAWLKGLFVQENPNADLQESPDKK